MSEAAVEAAPEASPNLEVTPEPDPVEATPEVEAAPAPAGPDFTEILSSPEAKAAIEQATEARLAEMFREETPPEAPADPLAGFDFLDDDAPQKLAQTLADFKQQILDEVRQSPAIQHAEQESARQWADTQFGAIEGELKTTLTPEVRGLAIGAAMGLVPQYGSPEKALAEAAKQIHAYGQAQRQAALDGYEAGLGTGDAPLEPGPGGAAAIQTEDLSGLSYLDLAHRHFGGG